MTIFGISLGTTSTGVCVLRDDEILDRRMLSYPEAWSDDKLRKIIGQYRHYVHKYGVKAIMIKLSPLTMHTPAIRKIIGELEALASEHGLPFDFITKTELKHVTGMRTTTELMHFTRLLYPELNVLLDRGRIRRGNYNRKLFEAVLSAHVYQERLRVRALQEGRSTE